MQRQNVVLTAVGVDEDAAVGRVCNGLEARDAAREWLANGLLLLPGPGFKVQGPDVSQESL